MRLTEAEWRIMGQVWDRHPTTAREVLEGLGPDSSWAYSTVKTMLARLAEKGALAVMMRANTSVYEPLLERSEARRAALTGVLKTAFGGALGSMVHMLLDETELSSGDREELRRRLAALDRETAAGEDSP